MPCVFVDHEQIMRSRFFPPVLGVDSPPLELVPDSAAKAKRSILIVNDNPTTLIL
jgi:hypothetical protein